MGDLIRYIRSAVRLGWLTVLYPLRAVVCAMQGRREMAREHLRMFGVIIHDDLLGIIVRLQGLMRKPVTPGDAIDRILIVKVDRIGDMVCTTPVFDVLRSAFPSARLDIVGHPVPLGLLEGDDRIDQRIPYRSALYHALPLKLPGAGEWQIVNALLRKRYPLVVYLRGSFPFLLLSLTSWMVASKFVPSEPTVRRYFKPLETVVGPLADRRPRLHVGSRAMESARTLLFPPESPEGPRVVIHPVASAPTKMWEPRRFVEVADALARTCQAHVHFVGSGGERGLLERMAHGGKVPHAYHADLTLPEVVALISACDLFIGNDSGLAHVAAAVGTPMVVLWGPANLEMARPSAEAGQCRIIYHDIPCRESCPETHCTNRHPLECLTRIETMEVINAAMMFLKRDGVFGVSAG